MLIYKYIIWCNNFNSSVLKLDTLNVYMYIYILEEGYI